MSKIEPLEYKILEKQPNGAVIRDASDDYIIDKLNELIIKVNNHDNQLSGLVEEVSTMQEGHKHDWKWVIRDIYSCSCGEYKDLPVEDTNKDSERVTAPVIEMCVTKALKQERERIIKAVKELNTPNTMITGYVWADEVIAAVRDEE